MTDVIGFKADCNGAQMDTGASLLCLCGRATGDRELPQGCQAWLITGGGLGADPR